MRRKPDQLLPIEAEILGAMLFAWARGIKRLHGYALAKEMREHTGARTLLSHGTLYKALDRLEAQGMLRSEWEDPALAAQENRPRRRLYEITTQGQEKLTEQPPASRIRVGATRGAHA